MLKPFPTFISLILIAVNCYCQEVDSVSLLIKDIQHGKNDSIRFAANDKFTNEFEKLLLRQGSFTANFDSLKNVSVRSPDDKSFRIYTWNVPHYDGKAYDYFGFIQIHTDKSDTLIRLQDSTNVILKPESEKLRSDRWFGVIYYSILTTKKSGKTYYTLLGWKGKNETETEKVIDVLYFTGNQVKFGYPFFKTGSVFHNRMLFTFNANATMTLRFDKSFGAIVFDHFSSTKNAPASVDGPDGSYDAFRWKKDKWILYQDVDLRTKWNPSDKRPVPPAVVK